MIFVSSSGEGVEVAAKRRKTDDDTLGRTQALAMLAMQQRKISLRKIGAFFGVSYVTVKRRIDAIPPEARRLAQPVA